MSLVKSHAELLVKVKVRSLNVPGQVGSPPDCETPPGILPPPENGDEPPENGDEPPENGDEGGDEAP